MGSSHSKPNDQMSTPLKNSNGGASADVRHLDIDPRSPGLDRTPIVVDKTPDLTIIDPRSPTAGILRTPIVNIIHGEKGETLEDSLLLDSGSYKHNSLQASDESGRVSDLSVSTELNSLSLSDADECSNLLSIKEETINKKSKTKKTQPKQLFPSRKKTILMKNDMPRSPLSSVQIDSNSPRNIVQRKQTKKIDTARSCRLDSNFCPLADKENV